MRNYSAGCEGEPARGFDGWNTFDTDKKLKTTAGQQTQETALCLLLRSSVQRTWPLFPPCIAMLPPWDAGAVSVESVTSVESVNQQFVATSRAAVTFAPNTGRRRWHCHSTDVTKSTKHPDRARGTAFRAGFVEFDSFVEFVIRRSPAASRAAVRRIANDEFENGFD